MCSQSEYHVHAMKHVLLIAETSELHVVYHDLLFWVTVKLPSSTSNYIGERRANHSLDERSIMKHWWLPMPPRQGRINAFMVLILKVAKKSVNWCTSIPKCGRNWDACVTPANFGEVKIILGKTAGEMAGIDVFIKISEEDNIAINCCPSNQLWNKLLKKYGPW